MARSLDKIREVFPFSDDCFELQKTIDRIMNEKQFYASKLNRIELKRLDDRLTELNDYFAKLNCKNSISSKKIKELEALVAQLIKERDAISS
jgi:predicted nuclease with TOPRIM domain